MTTTLDEQNETVEEKLERRHRMPQDDRRKLIIRNVLNILFMVIMIAGMICWWKVDEQLGYKVLIASIPFKLAESVLRMLR